MKYRVDMLDSLKSDHRRKMAERRRKAEKVAA